MKLNSNFDTLWTKAYGDQTDPCDTSYLFRQVIQVSDSDYMILGEIMDYNDQRPHIVLVKTDYQGNVLWKSFLGYPPGEYHPYSIQLCSDKGIIIGSLYWSGGLQTGDPIVIKVDSSGSFQWQKNFGSQFLDYAAIVDTTIFGEIMVGCIHSDSALSNDSYYGKKYFLKLDNEGNVIWEKKFGESYINNRLWSINLTSNGGIISAGCRQTYYPATPHKVGWMFCLGPDGDSLWYREYIILNGKDSWNYFYDVIPTNEYGFIACGSVYPMPPDTGTQDVWVVKVDSLGCESPSYCWVNVEEEEEEMIPAEKGKMVLFPNPAIDVLNLSLPEDHFKQGMEVHFYNIFGQVQEKLVVSVPKERLQVDVTGWPPGIYIVRIHLKGALGASEKFIVQ